MSAVAAPGRRSWVRDNLEAVVVAIILALLIKQFAMEAFVIPTGSMAPTLLGAHVDVDCPNCGLEQSVSNKAMDAGSGGPNVAGRCESCGRGLQGTLPEDALTMAEALRAKCKNCGAVVTLRPIPPRAGTGASTGEARVVCQSCRFAFTAKVEPGNWPFGSVSRGDRILVNKWIYRFREPRRNEVIVFKFPNEPAENYIKRIAGIPGDLIDIRDGDIYVNGAISRKEPDVQDAVWVPVHDGRHAEKDGGGARGEAWRAEREQSFARAKDQPAWKSQKAGDEPLWLDFARPITDWNGYNVIRGTEGGQHAVRDVRVGARVEVAGQGAALLARLEHGDDVLEAAIEQGSVVVRHGETVLEKKAISTDLAKAFDLAFWRADEQVVLEIDGERVVHKLLHGVSVPGAGEEEGDQPGADEGADGAGEGAGARAAGGGEAGEEAAGPAPAPGPVPAATRRVTTRVRLGVRRGEVRLKDITVDRDIYYLRTLPTGSVPFPFRIGPGELFVLGDNSSNSTDSRRWGIVPRGHVVGRAFLVFWPAVPYDFAVRRIR